MLAPALLAAGVLFLVIGVIYRCIYVPRLRSQVARRSASVEGTLTEVRKIRRRRQTTKYLCTFSYTVGGQPYELRRVRSFVPHEEGERVTVFYQPEKPTDAHAEGFHTNPEDGKKAAMVILILGAVFAGLGILFLAK